MRWAYVGGGDLRGTEPDGVPGIWYVVAHGSGGVPGIGYGTAHGSLGDCLAYAPGGGQAPEELDGALGGAATGRAATGGTLAASIADSNFVHASA